MVVRSLRAVACSFLLACGPGVAPATLQSGEAPRQIPALVDPQPWCHDSEIVPACEQNSDCTEGSVCFERWCQPLWRADCQPHCIPKTHPQVLCHGSNEVHGLWTESIVNWMSVLEPAGVSTCVVDGKPAAAWSVWGVVPDLRSRKSLDFISASTWTSRTTFCTSEFRGEFWATDFFVANPNATVYLLGPPMDASGFGFGEVIPNP